MFKNNITTPILPLNYRDNSNQFYVKRDDLLPLSFGGNKVRIAKEYFKDMYDKDCDTIISYGNSRSNLNRVIANLSQILGVSCYIVSPLDESGKIVETNNSRMVKSMDVSIISCNKNNVSETIEMVIDECNSKGHKPYYINGDKYGRGNEKIGVEAYVKAYEEIVKYEQEVESKFDYIFHASGTGITQAGLICGKLKNNDDKAIVGISIARDEIRGKQSINNNIVAYFEDTYLKDIDNEIKFVDKYINGGYGKYDFTIDEMIDKILKFEGLPLDRTYTGKAFLGMTKYIKEKNIKNAKILFIHTGGTPLFFDDLINKREEDL